SGETDSADVNDATYSARANEVGQGWSRHGGVVMGERGVWAWSALSCAGGALENGSLAPVSSSVGFGSIRAKSATNGIVPPAPIATGSRPNASVIARRIAA